MKKLFAILFFSALTLSLCTLSAQFYTWTEDIAPLIYENCSSCHHDGGIAPFQLMSYEDVSAHAYAIHHATDERSMPPWPADPGYRHFKDENYLEEEEIQMLHDWIFSGEPYGDPALEPPPPVFPENGSLLESVDLVLAIEPYTLQYNQDEYRWFVLETDFEETVYISKIEVMAGLENVVHHADLYYDVTGNSLALDQQDPLSGFNWDTGTPTNSFYINGLATRWKYCGVSKRLGNHGPSGGRILLLKSIMGLVALD